MYIIGSRRMGTQEPRHLSVGGNVNSYTREEAITEATRLGNSYAGVYEFVVLECTTIHISSIAKPVKVKKDVIVFD